jgi:uncharacterized protein (TIGR03435 family)
MGLSDMGYRGASQSALAIGALLALACSAQTPTFEVVSVKPGGSVTTAPAPGQKTWSRTRPLRFSGRNLTGTQTLKFLIQFAYSLEDWAVEGPTWFNEEVFEIRAVMPAETSPSAARLMLRSMLADRFSLKFHTEKREIEVYALVTGKSGFKLKPLAGDTAQFSEMQEDHYVATGNLDAITAASRHYADRPVVNLTGIDGVYHLEFTWTRGLDSRYDAGFWSAFERATGLKRETRKIPRDMIIVDRANRVPTPD